MSKYRQKGEGEVKGQNSLTDKTAEEENAMGG